MTVQIIGGGAVGLLMASFFSEKDINVEIVSQRSGQCEALCTYGLVRKGRAGEEKKFSVGATTQIAETPELVIIATKYNALAQVYPLLMQLPTTVPLLFLQNGLAHFEEALHLPHLHIAFGSAQFGAQRENDYMVIHKGIGVLKVAVARGAVEKFAYIDELQGALLPIQHEMDAEKMLLEKALLNCFINPLTAILKVKNGELLTNAHAYSLLEILYEELMAAFPSVRSQFPFDRVKGLCEKTAMNTSSMLADRLAGRKTEVDTIVGAILAKAARNQQRIPTLYTLYQTIKALEQVECGDKM
ncbi:2-dehydropantoate 2-reductase [Lysinibacillus sp. KU-BSD001]|uniref:ketopantoate reductase family protein n=1 Tax=Lysinibacillus sp. KU-BSD001 TaxID=3141328 RepID=UPI0036EEE491